MLRNKSYKYLNNDETLGFIQNYTSDEIENKFRVERTIIREQSRLTFGIGSEYARYLNSTYQRIFAEGTTGIIDYFSALDLYKGSGFIQHSGSFKLLRYTAGLRTDFNSYSGSMSNPLKQLSPRIGLTMPVSDRISFNMGAGHFYQLPAYTTLGYRNAENVLVNKLNDLKYIGSTQGSAGFDFLYSDNTQFVAEGFYKLYSAYPFSVSDSISLVNKGGDFGVVGDEDVLSTGEGRAYGFEILARSKKFGKYSFVASYTFVYSEFKDMNGVYVPTAWDQRHLLNILFTRNFDRNWTIGLKWRYAGGSPYTPYDEELSANVLAWDAQGRGYLDYSRFNSERLPGAHQLDFRIDKEYFLNKSTLNFYLDIQNAYNFKAKGQDFLVRETDSSGAPLISNPGAPVEEQIYVLKTLLNTSGTIIPTLGIIIEF